MRFALRVTGTSSSVRNLPVRSPCANGLYMLVEQARIACELFLGREIPAERSAEVTAAMETERREREA